MQNFSQISKFHLIFIQIAPNVAWKTIWTFHKLNLPWVSSWIILQYLRRYCKTLFHPQNTDAFSSSLRVLFWMYVGMTTAPKFLWLHVTNKVWYLGFLVKSQSLASTLWVLTRNFTEKKKFIWHLISNIFITVKCWDLASNQTIQVAQHDAPVKVIRWVKAPNYTALMTGSWDKTLKFWDTRSPNPIMSIDLGERCYVADVDFPMAVVGTANRGI